jgi:hypothetical protein
MNCYCNSTGSFTGLSSLALFIGATTCSVVMIIEDGMISNRWDP